MAREMKDSGIAWIGQIPEDWNISKMKQIGQFINGYAFKPEDWSSQGLPIIRIQDLTGSNDAPNYYCGEIDKRYLIRPNDILVSWAATLDAFIWKKSEGWLNQHIFKAIPNVLVQYKFFYWLIKTAMENMNNENKHGIVMQHVTTNVFGNFAVPLPTQGEQLLIANFLDEKCNEIDELVALQEKMIDELKAYKQSVITETVTKGLDKNVKMKDSGVDWIGEIPENWEMARLKNEIKFVNGYAFKSDDFTIDEGIRVIRIGDIADTIDFRGCVRAKVNNEGLATYRIQENDILIAMSGATTGKCGIAKDVDEAYINQRVGIIRTEEYHFIFYSLRTNYLFEYISLHNAGSAQPNISSTSIGDYPIPCPPLSEQHKIATYLDKKCSEIDSLISIKQKKIEELKDYKKSLIYEYVTGKKQVGVIVHAKD